MPALNAALGSRCQQQLQAVSACHHASIPVFRTSPLPQRKASLRRQHVVRAEPEVQTTSGLDDEELRSEVEQKRIAAERLRAAEKFLVIGAGNATCKSCGFEYKPENGDPEFPIPKGMRFENVPAEYICPVCGAGKERFEASTKVVAGFAANQGYGLGTNTMTGDQKLALIYGSLLLFFILFLGGYALE